MKTNSPADDAQGARARHEQDRLSQRLGPAERRAADHGARPGHARPRDPGSLPALLPLFRDHACSTIAASRSATTIACSATSRGVDGIKTGYTRASGFNLVSSMRRGNRHLVGVVLGGRSGGSRDATMRNLLAENLDKARDHAHGRRDHRAQLRRRPTVDVAEAETAVASEPRRCRSTALAAAEPGLAAMRRRPLDRAGKAVADGAGRRCPASAASRVEQTSSKPQAKPEPAPLTSGVIQTQPISAIPARPSR